MKLWLLSHLVSALKSLIPNIHDQQKKTWMSIINLGNSTKYIRYFGGACGERLPHKPLR
jgi:hypothetical protein